MLQEAPEELGAVIGVGSRLKQVSEPHVAEVARWVEEHRRGIRALLHKLEERKVPVSVRVSVRMMAGRSGWG